MWGGLLTLFAALFHIGLLLGGDKYIYLAGIPNLLSKALPIDETIWIIVIILILLAISIFAFRTRQNWTSVGRVKYTLASIAVVLLIWGITGAPLTHLNDWSHGYSIFHVAAAFFITLTGSCFGVAAWSIKRA